MLSVRQAIVQSPDCSSRLYRGAGMAEWREQSPPTNVALVRISDPASLCGLSLLMVLILETLHDGYFLRYKSRDKCY